MTATYTQRILYMVSIIIHYYYTLGLRNKVAHINLRVLTRRITAEMSFPTMVFESRTKKSFWALEEFP